MSRKITKIIVHCSDSPDDRDIGATEIRDWHVKGNGWANIGYHYVIRRNGHIELGRLHSETGAHVAGQNNDSIGICWVGRNKISDEQKETLLKLLKNLIESYNLPKTKVFGHKEFDPKKTCPNLDMEKLRGLL